MISCWGIAVVYVVTGSKFIYGISFDGNEVLIYFDESPCTALKINRSSLNLILWVTGSQCSCSSTGVI